MLPLGNFDKQITYWLATNRKRTSDANNQQNELLKINKVTLSKLYVTLVYLNKVIVILFDSS